jgi:hypothetical protein
MSGRRPPSPGAEDPENYRDGSSARRLLDINASPQMQVEVSCGLNIARCNHVGNSPVFDLILAAGR